MSVTPLENWIVQSSGIKERNQQALREYQLSKIKEVLCYVKKYSKFYRERLSGFNENKIETLDDFKNIDFTYPYHIRQNPLDFLCVPQREIKRIVTIKSSGTSGEEKRIYFSEQDLNLTIDFFKVGMSCLTDPSDKVMVLLPGNSYGSIGDLLKRALEMSNIECFVHGVVIDTKLAAKEIIENNITCLVGIPIQVLRLSRLYGDVFKNNIKKVLLSTDYVPDVLIQELTYKYECKVFTHYGMTEMGYGGGVECEMLGGYHLREKDLFFEIVDIDTGEAVQDGQLGEVVFTTLTRDAMPLVRYRTGDIASFSLASCGCGTILKTMNRVKGRVENRITLGDNKVLLFRELEETILRFNEILDYKAYITNENILKVDLVSENKCIKNDTLQSIEASLNEKLGDKTKLQITKNFSCNSDKILNSMVKRKVIDYRGLEL